MALAIRRHIQQHFVGPKRLWGTAGATFAAALAAFVFVGQIVGKWEEGGWVVLISLTTLVLMAHAILISPLGYRNVKAIHRIIREKSRVQGPMGNIVEWQSLRTQEYRYNLLAAIARFWELFGVRRPMRFEPPVPAGEFDDVMHAETHGSKTLLDQYLDQEPQPEPHVGGKPSETAADPRQ
jgi:hypothetical protein